MWQGKPNFFTFGGEKQKGGGSDFQRGGPNFDETMVQR